MQLADRADNINTRFKLLNEQFETYRIDIEKYRDYLETTVSKRDDERNVGNPDNEGN